MKDDALHYFNADLMERFVQLHAAHEALTTAYGELESQYKKDTDNLESKVLYYKNRHDLLVQQLYGKKSEKRQLSTPSLQLSLPGFEIENRPEPPAVYEKVEYTRKKKAPEGTRGERSSRFPDWLRREIEEVKPESTTCPCCNKEMKKADTPEITEKLCCSLGSILRQGISSPSLHLPRLPDCSH